jgi:hypothetical protein
MRLTFSSVTFVLASIGAVLGVINGVRQILSARIRLRIRCYPLNILKTDTLIETYACVEVANAGSFPVTIKEVSFQSIANPKGHRIDNRKRNLDGKPLPLRVEPHDSIQVLFPDGELMSEVIKQSKRVVVETACGEKRYGSLRQWQRKGYDS